MSFIEGCVVNNDSGFEVYDKFDSDGHLFVAIYEDIPNHPNNGVREQSVYLTREQVKELIEHLNKALTLPQFGE